jgi:hypothetical protein
MAGRRNHIALAFACICIFFLTYTGFRRLHGSANDYREAVQQPTLQLGEISLSGHAIAPKLGNETAKAELGRATWKFFHTVMARFPEKPTEEESNTLRTFIYSFQRVYPCGECAEHFGKLLEKFPPQTSSRNAAAGWACHVHNQVNKKLKKDMFDCNQIGDFYDCGCAEDEAKEAAEKEAAEKQDKEMQSPSDKPEMSIESRERLSENGRQLNPDLVQDIEIGHL